MGGRRLLVLVWVCWAVSLLAFATGPIMIQLTDPQGQQQSGVSCSVFGKNMMADRNGRLVVDPPAGYRAGQPIPLSVPGRFVIEPFDGVSGVLFDEKAAGSLSAVVIERDGPAWPEGKLRSMHRVAVEMAFRGIHPCGPELLQFLAERADLLGVPAGDLLERLEKTLAGSDSQIDRALSEYLSGKLEKALQTIRAHPREGTRQGLFREVVEARIQMERHAYAEAEALLRSALKRRSEDPALLERLSDCLVRQGHYEEASRILQNALDLRHRLWAPRDLSLVPTMRSEAELLLLRGRSGEAESVLQNGLRICDSNPGTLVLLKASLHRRLGFLYKLVADSSADLPVREKSLTASARSFELALTLTSSTANAAAVVVPTLMDLGILALPDDPEKARTYFEKSLRRAEQNPGGDSVTLLSALRGMGAFELRYGSKEQAARLLERALTLARRRFGDSSRETALSELALADSLRLQGDPSRAAERYTDALAHFDPTLDRRAVVRALTGLAVVSRKLGRVRSARDAASRARTLATEILPDPDALDHLQLPVAGSAVEPAAPSMLNLTDWTLRWNFDAPVVPFLPLQNVRSFDDLALLVPGVYRMPMPATPGPAVGLGIGTPGQFSVNGSRGRSNNFTIDGSDNNDADIGVRRQGFLSRVPQTVDSIQEFQIQSAGFQAEFGRAGGSIVNVVSRSGTANLHGNVYGLYSSDALASRGFFDNPFSDSVNQQPQLSGGSYEGERFRRVQFGGTLGGAILKDRLFLFASAEHQRLTGSRAGYFLVPSPTERGLRVNPGADPTGVGFIPVDELGSFLDSRDIPYGSSAGAAVFSLLPLPNDPEGPFGANTYAQVRPRNGSGSVFSFKTDYYLSATHSLTGRYNFTDDRLLLPFTGEAINSSLATETRTQNISTYLNSVFGRSANMLRVSYGRTRLRFPPDRGDPLLFGSDAHLGNGEPGAPAIVVDYGRFGPFGATGPIGQLEIAPYSPVGIDVFNFPQRRVDNTYQISDTFSWIHLHHSLQIGLDLRRYQLNSQSDRNSRPLIQFGWGIVSQDCLSNPRCPFATEDGFLHGSDLAALGAASATLQALSTQPVLDSTIGLRLTELDLFAQDNWRLSDTLSVNLGLRYELHTVPTEVNGRIERTFSIVPSDFGHLDPSLYPDPADRAVITLGNQSFDDALTGLQSVLDGRQSIYASDANNLAPRIGFAWSPSRRRRMVLRAGYGIFLESNLGAVTSQSRNVFPTFVPFNLDPNFSPPTGQVLNSPYFAVFSPTGESLIRPGTLNSYNLTGDAFATGLGTLFGQAPAIPGGNLSSNGLAFTLPELDLPAPYAQHFVASLEGQIARDYAWSVAYVGTRGTHLVRFVTPNGGLASTPVLLFPAPGPRPLLILDIPPSPALPQLGRPQSSLGAYRLFQNSARSSYHSLQATFRKRFSRGIQFQGSWTWGHSIDEVSDPFPGRGFFSLPQDSTNMALERASSSFDVRHRFVGFLLWNLPELGSIGLLDDTTFVATAEFQTGPPFTVNSVVDRNLDGNLTDRPDTSLGILSSPDTPRPLRLARDVGSAALLAPVGQNGRLGRNTFRADGISRIDLALTRRVVLDEGRSLNLRLEAFNVLNRTAFGIPIRLFESPGFGQAYDTQTRPRTVRVSVQLDF